MKVGVIGSGDVGKALAKGFASRGHQVMIGSRDQAKVAAWAKENKATTGDFSQTAKFGDLVVLATKWDGTQSAIKLAGAENFAGKTVIDCTNPLIFEPNKPPRLALGFDTSAGEEVQRWLADAKVVKAFNTVGNAFMVDPAFAGGPPDMFICGNDDGAKKTVTEILTSFGWPGSRDLGGIEGARLLEPLAMLWITYGFRTNTWSHAFKLLQK